jgi:tryptophanyl-tRNA synthetase
VPPKDTQPTPAGTGVAKEQKITPFDVQGGVDAEGKSTGM